MRTILTQINFEDEVLEYVFDLVEEYDNKLYLLSSLEKEIQLPQEKLVKDFIIELVETLARARAELRFYSMEWLESEMKEAQYRLEYFANNLEEV
tara:strand:+ start:1805 stop:2089 length:285 start_codon:yes stop_codon:yes gene_type:complete